MNADRHLPGGCALLALVWFGTHCGAAEKNDAPQYAEHQDLSYYISSDGSRRAIHSSHDWLERRRHIVGGMEEAMGPLPRPKQPVPLAVTVEDEHRADGLIRRKLAY